MTNTQREILSKLIIYCDYSNYDLLSYTIGSGICEIRDTARVIDKYGATYNLAYDFINKDWSYKQ